MFLWFQDIEWVSKSRVSKRRVSKSQVSKSRESKSRVLKSQVLKSRVLKSRVSKSRNPKVEIQKSRINKVSDASYISDVVFLLLFFINLFVCLNLKFTFVCSFGVRGGRAGFLQAVTMTRDLTLGSAPLTTAYGKPSLKQNRLLYYIYV